MEARVFIMFFYSFILQYSKGYCYFKYIYISNYKMTCKQWQFFSIKLGEFWLMEDYPCKSRTQLKISSVETSNGKWRTGLLPPPVKYSSSPLWVKIVSPPNPSTLRPPCFFFFCFFYNRLKKHRSSLPWQGQFPKQCVWCHNKKGVFYGVQQ